MKKQQLILFCLCLFSAVTSTWALNAPRHVIAMDTGNGTVTLVWSVPDTVNTRHYVYSDKGLVATILANTQKYVDSNPGSSYYVVAFNSTQISDPSPTVAVEPNQIPAIPVLKTIFPTDNTMITLAWQEIEHATAYNVHGNGGYMATVNAPSTTYTDIVNLTSAVHGYTVTAINQNTRPNLYSDYSVKIRVYPDTETDTDTDTGIDTPDTATSPESAAGLKATLDQGSVKITWSSVSNAKGYNLYRDSSFVDSINAPSTSYIDYTPGSSYSLTAYNEYGRSDRTSTQVVNTNNNPATFGSQAANVYTNATTFQGAGNALGTLIRTQSGCLQSDTGKPEVISGGTCSLTAPLINGVIQYSALTEWILNNSTIHISETATNLNQFHYCTAVCVKEMCRRNIQVIASSVCLSSTND